MKKNCAFFGTNNLIAPKKLLNKLFAQSLSALYQWRPRSDEKGGGSVSGFPDFFQSRDSGFEIFISRESRDPGK